MAVAVFAGAVWLLENELADHHLAETIAYIEALPLRPLFEAGLFTAGGYLALVGYDFLALRYAEASVPPLVVAKTSFIASTLAHNLGFAAVTGGAVRYRAYSAAGLDGFQIATVIAFHAVTFPVGVSFLGGLALVVEPHMLAAFLGTTHAVIGALGALLMMPAIALLAASGMRVQEIVVARWRLAVPSFQIAVGQLSVAVLDLAFAAGALYVLLPETGALSFPVFLSIYLTALLAAVLSSVPGGIGVFEGLIVTFLSSQISAQEALGALLAYRGLYYLAPMFLAIGWFGASELAAKRRYLSAAAQLAHKQLSAIAPPLAAAAVFLAGAILLISGAFPEGPSSLEALNDWLPLAIIEGSHLVASVTGVGLLLLSGALLQRVDAAYFATLLLLAVGAVAAMGKGADYHEAIALTGIFLVLWPTRSAFYRRGALMQLHFSRSWFLAVAAIIAGSIWLGCFAHRYVEYSSELWWQVELDGNAPRFLRASLLVSLVFTAIAIRDLLQPRRRAVPFPTDIELRKAAEIISASPDSSANLALLGDKLLLFGERDSGFIMYRVQGSTWIAMGDPIGPAPEQRELLWRFRELGDEYGGRTVFYQVKPENLALYADMGLALYKMGDEARVDLAALSLDTPARRDLRRAHRRAIRDGAVFKLLSAEEVRAHITRLRAVSNEWLALKAGREKGFSLGFFDEDYLARFRCGVVMHAGEIVAFANIWEGARQSEISIDLMRHTETPIHGVMDFLIAELMLWGKAQGFGWFNLGMAPLSGLEARRVGPLWHKVGALIYNAGEQFYSFRGLRQYKDKFGPEWRPKYLASPGGLALGRVLVDLTALISGSGEDTNRQKHTSDP